MRMYSDIIRDMRGGLNDIMSEKINELVLAVADVGKAGSVTLKMTVKPDAAGDNVMTFEYDYSSTLPKKATPSTTMFHDGSGNVTRTDPMQSEMSLSRVAEVGSRAPGLTGDKLREAVSA